MLTILFGGATAGVAWTLRLSTAAKNAALNAVTAAANGGTVEVYDGAQPASPDSAVTTQRKLVTLALSGTAFGGASGGAAAANPVSVAAAALTGTASWFRMKSSAGTALVDGSVGLSGCDLNLTAVAINAGDGVALAPPSLTQP